MRTDTNCRPTFLSLPLSLTLARHQIGLSCWSCFRVAMAEGRSETIAKWIHSLLMPCFRQLSAVAIARSLQAFSLAMLREEAKDSRGFEAYNNTHLNQKHRRYLGYVSLSQNICESASFLYRNLGATVSGSSSSNSLADAEDN